MPKTRQWEIQISMFGTRVDCFFFRVFELSRVKLYRNELRGNKNYFELAGVSSYQGFELLSVKLH